MTAPIVSGEVRQAAREYVLAFPRAANLPLQALLGSERQVNAYVGQPPREPAWIGRYVPAHLRRYPFVAGSADGSDGAADDQRLTVAIDWDAAQLSWREGERLFTEGGEPSPLLERVQTALKTLHYDLERTQRLVQQIDDAGLLHEQALQVQSSRGKPKALTGFRVVDGARLDALDGDALKALHDSGALELVHAHRLSLTNLADSVLAKRPARAPEASAAPPPLSTGIGVDLDDPGTISFDGFGGS